MRCASTPRYYKSTSTIHKSILAPEISKPMHILNLDFLHFFMHLISYTKSNMTKIGDNFDTLAACYVRKILLHCHSHSGPARDSK